jgi:hypothetical protein
MCQLVRRRLAELVLEHADLLPHRIVDVVPAADVDDPPRLDPEELRRLALIGEEADVLPEGHALLTDERDRRAGWGLADRERVIR